MVPQFELIVLRFNDVNQIRNEWVILSRRNEKKNLPFRFMRSRRFQELAGAESTMEERDDRARQSLAGLPVSSSPGFLLRLGGAQRDLIRAGCACRGLAVLLGSLSGLVETRWRSSEVSQSSLKVVRARGDSLKVDEGRRGLIRGQSSSYLSSLLVSLSLAMKLGGERALIPSLLL